MFIHNGYIYIYIYIYKSIVFLYTSNKQNKVKKIPFKKASKYIKYIGINVTKGVHDFYPLYHTVS